MTEGRSAGASHGHLKGRVFKGTFWLLSGTFARAFLRLLVMAVLARLLVPEDFGLMSAAGIFVALAEQFAISGIVLSIVQRRDIEPRHVHTAYAVSTFAGLVVGACLWLAARPIVDFFDMPRLEPMLRVLILLFPLDAISSVSQKLFERDLAYGRLAAIDVASYVLGYAMIAPLFAWLGFGVWSLVYALIAWSALRSMMLMVAQRRWLKWAFDRRSYFELMHTGAGFTLARYSNLVAQKGDYFVVGRWLGAAALGLYDRAYVLMELSNSLLTNALGTVLFPAFSRLQDDRRALAAAFQRVSAVLALIFIPTGIAASLLAPEIIWVLLGGHWDSAVAPFRVIALAMFFRTAMKISSLVLSGAGAVYRNAWSQTLYAALIVGGTLATVGYGVTAVATATTVSLAIIFLITTQQAQRATGLGWKPLATAYGHAIPLTLLTSAGILAVALPMRAHGAHPLLILTAAGGIVAVLWATILLAWPRLLGPHGNWLLDHLPVPLPRPRSR